MTAESDGAYRIVFRVVRYSARGAIELERRGDGFTYLRIGANGGPTQLDLRDIAELAVALSMVEAADSERAP